MTKHVIFVNGRATAGKDTTINIMAGILHGFGWAAGAYSSIDPVRSLLSRGSIDVSRKTEEDRKLLAILGDALEWHSSFRTNSVLEAVRILTPFNINGHAAMFIPIREHDLLEKMKARILAQAITLKQEKTVVHKLFIERDVPLITTNAADANVPDSSLYDVVIDNNGSITELAQNACVALNKMVGLWGDA